MTSYSDVENYLLRKYATDEVISEVDAAINKFRQGERMSPPKFSQELCSMALKCKTIYEKFRLKGIFIKVLQGSTRRSVHNYLGKEPRSRYTGVGTTREINGEP